MRRWLPLAIAASLLLAVVAYFAPQVIRIVTNKGQIVIETDGAGIEVVIMNSQGTVLDTETKREITFKAGEYNIEVTVKDSLGEQRLVTDRFMLTRGSKKLVNARWEVAKEKSAAGEKAEDVAFDKPLDIPDPPPLEE